VASTLIQSKSLRAKARRAAPQPRFWELKPNAELDRAGDWLLGNLSAARPPCRRASATNRRGEGGS
jgi:hypothetical protein